MSRFKRSGEAAARFLALHDAHKQAMIATEARARIATAKKGTRVPSVTLPGQISRKKLSVIKMENAAELSSYENLEYPKLPKNYGECMELFGKDKPCPFVRCRHHLAIDIQYANDHMRRPSVKVNFPAMEVDEMTETCSIRQADGGCSTLEDTSQLMNLTKERVRQIEEGALLKMRRGMAQCARDEDFEHVKSILDDVALGYADDDAENN